MPRESGRFAPRVKKRLTHLGKSGEARMVDVSESGARLQVGHGWSVPDVFLIILKPGLQRWCQVVWRAERQVGVMFTTIPRSLASAKVPANAERFDVSPPERA
jgi:hypothetical protein